MPREYTSVVMMVIIAFAVLQSTAVMTSFNVGDPSDTHSSEKESTSVEHTEVSSQGRDCTFSAGRF